MNDDPQNPEKVHKKRGRKPKGGKIVKNEVKYVNTNVEKKNIILHLKCKLSDINSFQDITSYNPNLCNVEPFEKDSLYERVESHSPLAEEKKDSKVEANHSGENGNIHSSKAYHE